MSGRGSLWSSWRQRISQWVPASAQALIVLSVDGRWLKVLQAVGRPPFRTVTALLAHRVEGLSDEDILSWLKEACAARGIEPGPVVVANPSQLTTTRLFTLPSTDSAEIRDIVELQAEKHTPYAKEEILTDFQIVERDRAGYSRVLLVLSHQDIVHRGLKLVEGMGWPLESVGFELEGLVNWFRATASGTPNDGILVVEVDSETTTLVILHGDRPYFHRNLGMGVQQLFADPSGGPGQFAAELQRSLEAFEAEGFNLPLARVILTGQATRFPGLKDRIQQELELPTLVALPFERSPMADPALTQEESLAQVSFASLLGLTMRPAEIDLTPHTLKLHRAFEDRAKLLLGLGCQVIGMLVLVSCLIIGKVYKQERYHAWLLRQQQATTGEAQTMEADLQRLEFVKNWLKGKGRLLEVVKLLNDNTPPAIQWDALAFTKGQPLSLKGVSEEIPKVYEFTAALKRMPLLTDVEARRVTKRKVNDKDVTEFEIICSVKDGEETDGTETRPRS